MKVVLAAPLALFLLSSLAVSAHAQPRGSYLRSCTDVHMRGVHRGGIAGDST